jgi:ribosomal protein L35AE/L33A
MVDSNKLLAITLGAALLAKKKAAKGDQGIQGSIGERGLQGETGERGLIGEVGIQGEPGPKGDKGDQGDVGPMGPRGEKGDKGDRGEQGDIGIRGEKGDKGDTGSRGDKGLTGATGPKGDKGDKGDIGPMPKHKWEDTYLKFEIKPGEYGKAVDLRGPQGATGAQGPRGTGGITEITSDDGSIVVTQTGNIANVQVSEASPASTLLAQVRNESGSVMTKGTVVYISGAAGNKAVVSRAIATGDATSAQTMGIITANISNNQNGYATVFGQLVGLNTSAFAEGAQLYLSSTVAGSYTNIKQYAPAHLVYVGIVTRSHQNQGAIEVRIQNGYEMDELHNVSARSPANNDLLKFNSSTNLWEKYQGASGSFTSADGKTITVLGGLITSIA